jgi:hypothetical protein
MDWEDDMIHQLRTHPGRETFSGERMTPAARGEDEISVLAATFDRMPRSLVAAMKLLDQE